MTWSIVARDASGAFGVAVASKFFAVGALCPAVRAGKGALSTQALINPLYARDGLALLDAGADAGDVVRRLTEADTGRAVRQLHVVDAEGRTAAHTGSNCIDWCGHRPGRGYSVAGNMLAGPQVIEETARAYEAASALPFAERLMTAMEAGEAAGGDKRGKQGAALLIHTTEDYPFLSLRVDDHAEPLAELRRLFAASLDRFQPFMSCLPSRARPAGITDRAVIDAEVARFHTERAKG
jgi:uncharacterized Ntn-hydrolase superfamily protein